MKVEYGGRNFLIEFQRGKAVSLRERPEEARDYTRCILRDADKRMDLPGGGYSSEALVTGIAFRDSRDRDDREKGRKASLVQALGALDQMLPAEFSKERRAAFWSAYHGRKHQYPTAYVKFVQRGPDRNIVTVTWPRGEQHAAYAKVISAGLWALQAKDKQEEVRARSTC